MVLNSLVFCIFISGLQCGWSLSQLSLCKRQRTLWTGCQSHVQIIILFSYSPQQSIYNHQLTFYVVMGKKFFYRALCKHVGKWAWNNGFLSDFISLAHCCECILTHSTLHRYFSSSRFAGLHLCTPVLRSHHSLIFDWVIATPQVFSFSNILL